MKYPWSELSALMTKMKEAESTTPTGPHKPTTVPQESKDRHVATLVRYALLKGEYDRVVTLIQQEGDQLGPSVATDAWKVPLYLHAARQRIARSPQRSLGRSLKHLRKALDIAVHSEDPSWDPASVARYQSIERLFSNDPVDAFARYPEQLPSKISKARWAIERAAIALQTNNLSTTVAEDIRLDLLRRWHDAELQSSDDWHLKRLHADCLASCYWRQKMWPEVAFWLERLNPKSDHAAARALAYAYYQMAQEWMETLPARTIEMWRAIDELVPRSDMAEQLALSSLDMSRVQAFRAWGAGKSEEVIHFASVVVDIAKDWSRVEFLYLLVDAYIRLDKLEEAAEVVESLLDTLPGNVLVQLLYGLLLLATDDLRTARECLIPLAHDTGHPAAVRALRMSDQSLSDVRAWARQELVGALDDTVRQLLKGIQVHQWERDYSKGSVQEVVYKGPSLPVFSWWIVLESADSAKLTALVDQLMKE